MLISFDKNIGRVHELFYILFYLYNDNYMEMYEEFNLKSNKIVVSAIDSFKKKVNFHSIDTDISNLAFNKETVQLFFFPTIHEIWNYKDFNSLLSALKSYGDDTLKFKFIYNYYENDYENKKIKENEVFEIARSNQLIVNWIENANINNDVKWNIFRYLNNPKNWFDKYVNFIEKTIPEYEKLLKKSEVIMNDFNEYIELGIKENGIEFIKYLTSDFLTYDNIEEIHITTLFINSISTHFSVYKNKLYIAIGFEFEKTFKFLKGKNEIDIALNRLKNISDKTRFQILSLIKDKEMFATEIAEKLSLSMATISYHMNYLIASNFVKQERRGQKFYYTLDKEGLRKSVEFLNSYFNL